MEPLALIVVAVLFWWLRDRRSPDERLATALRADDLAYLRKHLPTLTPTEYEEFSKRLVDEIREEARKGEATGDWEGRFERGVFEERRRKANSRLRPASTGVKPVQ
jgi:hypothetical protein